MMICILMFGLRNLILGFMFDFIEMIYAVELRHSILCYFYILTDNMSIITKEEYIHVMQYV